ncbi:MAG: ComF family protein [Terriglobia bacterium]|nr:ComF family protein [Terriglobia bacterium]
MQFSVLRAAPEADGKEVVFSSSGDRTRADGVQAPPGRPLIANTLNALFGSLYSALFPSDCRLCSTPLNTVSRLPVCEACVNRIEQMPADRCRACGDLFPVGYQSSTDLCPDCAFEAPPFERAAAYGPYTGGLRELIHLLKYEQIKPAAKVLGRMLSEAANTLELRGEVIVIPVPLHAAKLRQRSFNQSELIAKEALRHLHGYQNAHFTLEVALMKRRRDTPSQVGMTREERAANLRGAFGVTSRSRIRGQQVLLVDDVLTTGATVAECTRVLRRGGAKHIWVATVARAVRVSATFAEARDSNQQAPLAIAARG